MQSKIDIPLEVIKELCRQSEMWEINNPRVIAMLDNIFKCIKEEQNLDDLTKYWSDELLSIIEVGEFVSITMGRIDGTIYQVVLEGEEDIEYRSLSY